MYNNYWINKTCHLGLPANRKWDLKGSAQQWRFSDSNTLNDYKWHICGTSSFYRWWKWLPDSTTLIIRFNESEFRRNCFEGWFLFFLGVSVVKCLFSLLLVFSSLGWCREVKAIKMKALMTRSGAMIFDLFLNNGTFW